MPTNLFNPADRRKYPARWPMRRGKQLFEVVDNRSEDGTEELLSVSHITGITPRSQKNVTMFKSESLVGYKRCEVGDIAANTMWTWQGAIGVSNYEGVVSPDYAIYHCFEEANSEYMVHLFSTELYRDAFNRKASGIGDGFSRLYTDDLFAMYSIFPPLNEQQKIVDFLDSKISKINSYVLERERVTSLN